MLFKFTFLLAEIFRQRAAAGATLQPGHTGRANQLTISAARLPRPGTSTSTSTAQRYLVLGPVMGALPTLPTPELCLVWAVITIIGEYKQLIIPFPSNPRHSHIHTTPASASSQCLDNWSGCDRDRARQVMTCVTLLLLSLLF